MSTATTLGPGGTLSQRRPDATVVSTGRPTVNVTRGRAARVAKLRSRVRYSVSQTFIYRVLVGILAGLSVVGALVVVFTNLFNLDSGAFYRASLLSIHGFTVMMALSAVVDQELFDLRTTLAFSVLSFAINLFLAVVGLIRHYGCPNGVTQLDVAICLNSPQLSAITPWVALAFTIVSLLILLLTGVWQNRRVAELRSIAKLALYNAVNNGTVFRSSMDAQIEAERQSLFNARQRRISRELTTGAGVFRVVVAVLLLVTVIFIVALNTIFFRGGAFYRGSLLIVPAHLAGCMFAFFGKTPNWWRWLTLVFAVLSTASAVVAAIFEWPRYVKCINADPFTKQIEEEICDQEGFRAAVWPIVSLVVGLLSILAAVSVVLSTRRSRQATATVVATGSRAS